MRRRLSFAAARIMESMILNGWKQIATHLGVGVRTAQRWEHEAALPVHRPQGHSRSHVMADSTELERWLTSSPERQADYIADLKAQISALKMQVQLLKQGTSVKRRARAASTRV